MNKGEFLQRLYQGLLALPQEEIKSAMSYYEEYFDDAGPEHEQDVIRQLGIPEEIVMQLIASSPSSGQEPVKRPFGAGCMETLVKAPVKIGWSLVKGMLSLAVYGALAVAALVFAAVVFWGICALGAGIVSTVMGLVILFSLGDVSTAIMVMGLGICGIGIGMLLAMGGVCLLKKGWRWLKKRMRKEKKEGEHHEKKETL